MSFGIFPELFHTQFSSNPIQNRKQDCVTSQLQILQGSSSLLDDAQASLAQLLPTSPTSCLAGPLLLVAPQGGPELSDPPTLAHTVPSVEEPFLELPSACGAPVHVPTRSLDITFGKFFLISSSS